MTRELIDAARQLVRRPGARLAAALSLGLGMSLATSVFTALQAIFLTPQVADPDRLINVYGIPAGGREQPVLAARHVVAARDNAKSVSAIAAANLSSRDLVLGESGNAARLRALAVTRDYFDVLGVAPVLGRAFSEATEDARRPVMLSHAIWSSRYGADPGVVGKGVPLDGETAVIVGVMPRGFNYPSRAQIWVPLEDAALRAAAAVPAADWASYMVFARLAPAATALAAESELQTLLHSVDAQAGVPVRRPRVLTVAEALRREYGGQIALWSSVALVIAFLCAVNFATMSLASGMRRRSEVAVRAAIGASPARLTWMLLAEALLLAVLAAVVAIVLAFWLSDFVRMSMSSGLLPVAPQIAWRLMLGGAALTVGAGVLFALIPSLHLGRLDLRPELAADAAATAGQGGTVRGRGALVALQVSLAVLCVASVLSLVVADREYDALGPGYDYDPVITARVLVADAGLQRTIERPMVEQLRAVPGIEAVAVSRSPIGPGAVAMATDADPRHEAGTIWLDVSPDYFATLGVRPLAGRLPTPDEVAGRAPVVVLGKTVASGFGGVDPLGRRIRIRQRGSPPQWLTVVGVVPDIRRGPEFQMWDLPIYTSMGLPLDRSETELVLRASGDVSRTIANVRSALASFNAGVVVSDLRTVRSDVERFTADARGRRGFLTGVALLALVLAAIGVYSLTSYNAEQRAKEIGIRLALGARGLHVGRVVLGDMLPLAAVGAILGVVGASRFSQVLDSLFASPRFDLRPLVGLQWTPTLVSAAVLLLVGLIGTLAPLRRVLRQDVVKALR